jgi:hypothetical protein
LFAIVAHHYDDDKGCTSWVKMPKKTMPQLMAQNLLRCSWPGVDGATHIAPFRTAVQVLTQRLYLIALSQILAYHPSYKPGFLLVNGGKMAFAPSQKQGQ